MSPAPSRLSDAASAYLRSAAHQPVHWFPWGEEAFAEARRLDRPVLLDVGAVWCHWCHVMDGESYEDPHLAELLNAQFVCIKVDRDERPDVDARYQRAIQALTGQGGWPLTGFLTPSGDVFYGGTYFPPDNRFGRPSFRSVLEGVARTFHERRDRIVDQASAIRRFVEEQLDESAPGPVSEALLDAAVEQMRRLFDPVHGGFGDQPKFPHPAALELLLARWHDGRDPSLRMIIERTLDGMSRGGIHDHLAGGFHRYSVDARWLVPHFEKMSYDNSELLRNYADAHAALGVPDYAGVARGIVRWTREVLADPAGGFGASQDADVGLDDDGGYWTWTRDEAAAPLPADQFEVAARYYDIGTAGEMPHDPSRNVLWVASSIDAIAREMKRRPSDVAALLGAARAGLLRARSERPPPVVDRSRFTSWNSMMAAALLRAAPVLEDEWAREQALATLRRIRAEAPQPDGVGHLPGGSPVLLEDQVQTAAAALDAWEATGDRDWLEWAEALMSRAWRLHRDPAGGGLFDRIPDPLGEGLLPTPAKPVQDSPTPSPNGTAALVCFRLEAHTAAGEWRARGEELTAAFAGRAGESGLYAATLLRAVDWQLNPATHLVVVGPPNDPEADRMHRMALAAWRPRRVLQRLYSEAAAGQSLPAPLAAMLTGRPGARGYLCTGSSCRPPADDLAAWSAVLSLG